MSSSAFFIPYPWFELVKRKEKNYNYNAVLRMRLGYSKNRV